MHALARNLIWRISLLCFRLFQASGIWLFHWIGNHTLFFFSQGRLPSRKKPNCIDLGFRNKFDRDGIALGPFVDKETAKYFVKSLAPEVRVPETIAVFRSQDALVGFGHSEPYVAKPTHSCGVVVLKPEGGRLLDPEIAKLSAALSTNYYRAGGEIQYFYLEKKVIVEEFVGEPPTVAPDFKFQFFEGVFQWCYVFLGRHTDNPQHAFLDEEGNPIPLEACAPLLGPSQLPFFQDPFSLPGTYGQMIGIARKLAKPFRFCRVDLFPAADEIVFGEFTFSPANCLFRQRPRSFMALRGPGGELLPQP